VCQCSYLEDTTTMVIKVPGPLNDKYPIWTQQCLD
jgi:hypothetical protein